MTKKTSMHGFGLFSDVENRELYEAGEVVFHGGDYAERMYVVAEGELLRSGDTEAVGGRCF